MQRERALRGDRGQRAGLRGFGLGAVAGGYAGGIAATAFVIGMLVAQAVIDDSGELLVGLGLMLVVAFVWGALVGAATGAVAGMVLGGLGLERLAPPLALVLAVVVGNASITGLGPARVALLVPITGPLFAPVGWLTGRWFERTLAPAGDPAPQADRA